MIHSQARSADLSKRCERGERTDEFGEGGPKSVPFEKSGHCLHVGMTGEDQCGSQRQQRNDHRLHSRMRRTRRADRRRPLEPQSFWSDRGVLRKSARQKRSHGCLRLLRVLLSSSQIRDLCHVAPPTEGKPPSRAAPRADGAALTLCNEGKEEVLVGEIASEVNRIQKTPSVHPGNLFADFLAVLHDPVA